MLEINNYAFSSRIAGKRPQYKIIFAAVPLLGCLFADSIAVSSLTLAVMGFMSVFNTKITWQKYLKLLMIPLGFLSLGTITIILQQYLRG